MTQVEKGVTASTQPVTVAEVGLNQLPNKQTNCALHLWAGRATALLCPSQSTHNPSLTNSTRTHLPAETYLVFQGSAVYSHLLHLDGIVLDLKKKPMTTVIKIWGCFLKLTTEMFPKL